jgi:hypothetical protein
VLQAPRLAALATLLWLTSGCDEGRVTRREPPLRRAEPQCAAGIDGCKSQCGSAGGGASASSEARCEAALGDLCRSRCEAACGEATATLERHIAEQERILESQCGSGKPVEPAEPVAPSPIPSPHPLNDLMR